MLRQIQNGRMALPNDPTQRAMVEEQLAFYKMNQKKQAGGCDGSDDGLLSAMERRAAAAGSTSADTADSQMTAETGNKEKKTANAQINAGLDALASDGAMQDKPSAADAMNDVSAPTSAGRELGMKLMQMPPDQRMQALMALPPKELASLRGSLQGSQLLRLTAGMTPEQKERLTALPGGVRMIALESMESRLDRDIYSERQLEAVMTDFWLNHFNVYVRKNQNEPYLLPSYERETIRPHALGRFEDLLVATAESPAMLVYLDNYKSVGPDSAQAKRVDRAKQMFPNAPVVKQASAGLNENYGRELMELHTLGVNGRLYPGRRDECREGVYRVGSGQAAGGFRVPL